MDARARRDDVASVSHRTPACSGLECQAGSAVVVGLTAGRNRDTGFKIRAPALVCRANAGAGCAVVVGALRQGITRFIRGTPACSGHKGQTRTAVVVGQAASRNRNARFPNSAPGGAGRTHALVCLAVLDERAVEVDLVALVRERAPAPIRNKG